MKKQSIVACLVGLLFASCAQQPTAQNPTCSPPPKEGSQVVGQQTRTVKVCHDVVVQETWVKHTRILSPKPSSIPSTKSRSTTASRTTSAPAVKKASPPTTVAPATPLEEAVVTNGGCKLYCGSGVTNGGNMIVNSPGASISDTPSEKKEEIVVPPPIERPFVEPEKMGPTVFEAPWAK